MREDIDLTIEEALARMIHTAAEVLALIALAEAALARVKGGAK